MTVLRPETRFLAPLTRQIRRLGPAGRHVAVSLRPEGIALTGAMSGAVVLEFAAIDRVRIGFVEARRMIPMVWIWRTGERRPLAFAGEGDRAGFAAFARATAAQFLRDRSATILETGSGLFAPIFGIGSFALMALGLAVFAIILAVNDDPDWWMPLPALAVPVVLLALLGPWLLRRYVPRRVERIEDIERALPGMLGARPASS
jgi:hypothetical protein